MGCGGKGQGSSLQEGASNTYTFRLGYSRNSILYEKIKHPTKSTTLVVDPPNPPKDKYHIHYKVCERDSRNLGKLSGLLHMRMKRYAFFNSEKLYINLKKKKKKNLHPHFRHLPISRNPSFYRIIFI